MNATPPAATGRTPGCCGGGSTAELVLAHLLATADVRPFGSQPNALSGRGVRIAPVAVSLGDRPFQVVDQMLRNSKSSEHPPGLHRISLRSMSRRESALALDFVVPRPILVNRVNPTFCHWPPPADWL